MGVAEQENPAQSKPVLCWCCETRPAVVCNCVPMGPKWGLVPVELCEDCNEEIG